MDIRVTVNLFQCCHSLFKTLGKFAKGSRNGAEKPARVFGLYPKKGAIAVGSDADLTVVDIKKRITLKAERLHSKSDFTPYEGWEV